MKVSRSTLFAILWGIFCALIACMFFYLASESDKREYELYHQIAQELADCNIAAESNTDLLTTESNTDLIAVESDTGLAVHETDVLKESNTDLVTHETDVLNPEANNTRDYTNPLWSEENAEAATDETSIVDNEVYYAQPVLAAVTKTITIDAGHQAKGDSTKEPIGPNSKEMKAKVTTGAVGVNSHLPESELNLTLALGLQKELEKRGYNVVMVRTSQDVNISNSARAEIANNAKSDAFIRIHANSAASPKAHGAMTICQTVKNPYNGNLHSRSYALSDAVLNALVDATGCKKERIWETDTMSGINWCNVPVTIVEVGYLSNPSEDALLNTTDYQNKIVLGLANGIDNYFAEENHIK